MIGKCRRVGTLAHDRGQVRFDYDAAWLGHPLRFAIDPDLSLDDAPFFPHPESGNFGIFLDSSPDRRGQTLMLSFTFVPMSPLVKPQHIAELLSKELRPDARLDIERLAKALDSLAELGANVDQQCFENRVKSGEAPKRVRAPKFAQEMSSKAQVEITNQVLRQVRRASCASEAATVLADRMQPDIEFLRQGAEDQRILEPSRTAIQGKLAATLFFQEQLRAFSRNYSRARTNERSSTPNSNQPPTALPLSSCEFSR